MENTYQKIMFNPLFAGINTSDFNALVTCLHAKSTKYTKNEMILLSGNKIDHIGIVASGRVKIYKEDWNGNQTILTEIPTNGIFGEVFACAGIDKSPVTITASTDCEIVYFDFNKVSKPCCKACTFHMILIENMLKIIANKNLMLNQKLDILSKRTLREKLLCFFEYQKKDSNKFTISFNREELASYLCSNRSVVSAELSRMQKDNIIAYSKNDFEIL